MLFFIYYMIENYLIFSFMIMMGLSLLWMEFEWLFVGIVWYCCEGKCLDFVLNVGGKGVFVCGVFLYFYVCDDIICDIEGQDYVIVDFGFMFFSGGDICMGFFVVFVQYGDEFVGFVSEDVKVWYGGYVWNQGDVDVLVE